MSPCFKWTNLLCHVFIVRLSIFYSPFLSASPINFRIYAVVITFKYVATPSLVSFYLNFNNWQTNVMLDHRVKNWVSFFYLAQIWSYSTTFSRVCKLYMKNLLVQVRFFLYALRSYIFYYDFCRPYSRSCTFIFAQLLKSVTTLVKNTWLYAFCFTNPASSKASL